MSSYGYIRVSTKEQNEDRQLAALEVLGISKKNLYMDKLSGKDFNRPQWRAMVRKLRKDDLLYSDCQDRTCRRCLKGRHFQSWQAWAKEHDRYCCADFSKVCSRYRPGEKEKT